MSIAEHDTGHYLKAARQLAASVAANADRIDSERQIPPELAGEMADQGFFRLLLPRSLGGAELDHPDFLRILEIFAEADGSTAWSMNQVNVFSTNSVRMPEQTAWEIWSEQRAVVTNGPPTSSCRAVPVDGGYRLSGRWNFSSGSTLATWIAALTPIQHLGQGPNGPAVKEAPRIMLVPRKDVKFIDSWQVHGLRGTGSFSFEAEDLYVPRTRTFDQTVMTSREDGPLYAMPRTTLFGSGFATVALGIARASLATAIDLAGTKTPGRSTTLLRDQYTTHRLLGEAEAIWHSAKAFLNNSASRVWESACKNRALSDQERIQLRLACTHAIRMAARVVDISYGLCGSGAIFATSPIQRRFQDMHVITQHIQGSPAHYETAGQFLLGLEPPGNF
jgi:alkylation response protein AidB-like acyl-CoA dehydrogenase